MNIKWQQAGGDPEDIKAVIGNDMLRVERLSRCWYWWAVYIGDETYDCWMYGSASTSLEDGKLKAENKYKEIKSEIRK